MGNGLGYLLKQPCAQKTLFLLSVREELSWKKSALGQVCWAKGKTNNNRSCYCHETCGNPDWLKQTLRSKPMELSNGPHNWIDEWMVLSPDYHTFMFDVSALNDVLACLPPGGMIKDSSDLASHVYKRDAGIKHANSASSKGYQSLNISDDAILAGYKRGNFTAYWVQPYVKAIMDSGCEVTSALGLQVAEHNSETPR